VVGAFAEAAQRHQIVECGCVAVERLRTDLGDKLRAAADVYDKQDHEAGGALDSSVRYG